MNVRDTVARGLNHLYTVVLVGILISIVFYDDVLATAVDTIPHALQLGSVVLILVWVSASMSIERVPWPPLLILAIGLIGGVHFSDTFITWITAIPLTVHVILVTALIIWTGSGQVLDTVPNQPFLFTIIGLIGTVLLTHVWIQGQHVTTISVIETGIAIPGGIGVWILATLMFATITASAFNIDLTKERFDRVDDPYGDPHSARILNEDEQSS